MSGLYLLVSIYFVKDCGFQSSFCIMVFEAVCVLASDLADLA